MLDEPPVVLDDDEDGDENGMALKGFVVKDKAFKEALAAEQASAAAASKPSLSAAVSSSLSAPVSQGMVGRSLLPNASSSLAVSTQVFTEAAVTAAAAGASSLARSCDSPAVPAISQHAAALSPRLPRAAATAASASAEPSVSNANLSLNATVFGVLTQAYGSGDTSAVSSGVSVASDSAGQPDSKLRSRSQRSPHSGSQEPEPEDERGITVGEGRRRLGIVDDGSSGMLANCRRAAAGAESLANGSSSSSAQSTPARLRTTRARPSSAPAPADDDALALETETPASAS